MFGEIKRNLNRIRYTSKVKHSAAKAGENLRVNNRSLVNSSTYLGRNVNFNGMEIIGNGKVTIGDNFHSGRGCLIITENHNYDGGRYIPYDDKSIIKDVVIEDNVWIGERVIILGGAHIEEGAIIQAGSVVVGHIPACSIAGGHPAKVFKKRDEEHYYTLKNKGMFH